MKKLLLPILLLASVVSIAQTMQKSIAFNGGTRNYLIHLPTGYTTGQHLPLVFDLHGSTATGALEEFYSNMSDVADTNHFIAAYPDGIGNVWNVNFTGTYGTGTDDVGFINNLIDTIAMLYHIDLSRVYSCGMSNGGFMSYRLACELSNRIAAIASVTGSLSDSVAFYCNPTRQMPIMEVHGTADPMVAYNGDTGYYAIEQTIQFWLSKNQCSPINDTVQVADINTHDSSTVEKIHYANCGNSTEVLFYKINGGGHTWPGTSLDWIYGPTNRDISASKKIWDFFKKYTLNGLNGVNNIPATALAWTVFPNPVNDALKIESAEKIDRVELLDVMGQVLLQETPNSINATLNMAQMSTGLYLIKIKCGYSYSVKPFVKM